MPCQPEKRARVEAMLGELAELGLMVAREIAVRTRESEDVDQTVALAGAFQKVSRVVRLTLALDFKLERDAAREARTETEQSRADAEAEAARQPVAPCPAPRRAADPIEARKDRVAGLLNRLIWNECEGDSEEYEILSGDLSTRLREAGLSPDFATLPVEVIARRVIADMGLSGEVKLSLREAANGDADPQPTPQPARQPADTG